MIERDVGDDRDAEIEDVGAVEPAAEPDLADEHLGVGLARREDPGSGEHLEAGRLQLLGQRFGRVAARVSTSAPNSVSVIGDAIADDPLAVRLRGAGW